MHIGLVEDFAPVIGFQGDEDMFSGQAFGGDLDLGFVVGVA